MAEPLRVPESPASTATTWEFLRTFIAILTSIGVFFIADVALARIDSRESASAAADLYEQGRGLLARGDAREATARFARAFAMERRNRDYELALAEASFAEGRVAEAERTLVSLLSRAETDGAVNIVMARVLAREGRTEEAKSYFHRAIYGRWRADTANQRMQSRLELIAFLASRGDSRELLAELLPLQDVAEDSIAIRRRIGHLFIAAGSPARGVGIFRELLRRNHADGDAYAGLGEAALALGNFRTARADLLEAQRLESSVPRLDTLLAIADTIVALNPEDRGVSTHERFSRARVLLARTLAVIEHCNPPAADSARIASAQHLLASIVRPADEERQTDVLLTGASEVWAARPARCEPPASPAGDALARIHAHLGQ